jgi:hypothetical protein
MAFPVIQAGSISANYHVHMRYGTPNTGNSASAGLANEKTYFVPILTRNIGVYCVGAFGSGSASGTVAIDRSPQGSAFVNIASISASQFTTIPVYADEVIRVRTTWSSAIAAAGIGMSVDVHFVY